MTTTTIGTEPGNDCDGDGLAGRTAASRAPSGSLAQARPSSIGRSIVGGWLHGCGRPPRLTPSGQSSFWDCVALRRCGGLHAPPVSIWKSASMDGFLRLVPKAADWFSGWLAGCWIAAAATATGRPACLLSRLELGTGRGGIVGGWVEDLSVSFGERARERPSQQSTSLRCRTEERKRQLSG
ncbi:hypothetical protein BKA81DRAFT_358564 [Phyllosticta paracitricarpa]